MKPLSEWVLREAGGVEYRQCLPMLEACGVQTAFTTRRTGTSSGPFGSLNFGRHAGDVPGRVDRNWQLLFEALGIEPSQARLAQQVHGSIVQAAGDRGYPWAEPGADGLIDPHGALVLITMHADCAPVYLAVPGLHAHALVHAGWRGTAAGIAARAVEQLSRLTGRDPSEFHGAIGPCIRSCCYEVGPDVIMPVRETLGPRFAEAVDTSGPKLRLNLAAANRIILEEAGIPPHHIYDSGLCTACHPGDFFSHRRDSGVTGRMLAWQRRLDAAAGS